MCSVSYSAFMENVVNPHHHRLHLLDCNSLSTIWEVEAACYWFYLEGFYPLYYIFYFYNSPCIGEQLVRSACMNQCFPATSSVDCMQFNTSYLCFNYDDLLSVGSSGLLSQSAATSPVEYVIFYSTLYIHVSAQRMVICRDPLSLAWLQLMYTMGIW